MAETGKPGDKLDELDTRMELVEGRMRRMERDKRRQQKATDRLVRMTVFIVLAFVIGVIIGASIAGAAHGG